MVVISYNRGGAYILCNMNGTLAHALTAANLDDHGMLESTNYDDIGKIADIFERKSLTFIA